MSVLISAKTGRLSARLGFEPVIDVPVNINDPDKPLGTYLFTATGYGEGERSLNWNVVSLSRSSISRAEPKKRGWGRYVDEPDEKGEPVALESSETSSPNAALSRVQIPKEAAEALAELVKPGSSFIITDRALSSETGKRTDFIVGPR